MKGFLRYIIPAIAILSANALCSCKTEAGNEQPEGIHFNVSLSPSINIPELKGRVFLIISRSLQHEPRLLLPMEDLPDKPHVFAINVENWKPSSTVSFNSQSHGFPAQTLSKVPSAYYLVQAVLVRPGEILDINAPGNIVSDAQKLHIDPADTSKTINITLNQVLAEEEPKDSGLLHFVKIKSEILSQFHGRPIYLRAGVIVPRNFDKSPRQKYPLWIHIGGGIGKYTTIQAMMNSESGYWEIPDFEEAWTDEESPEMVFVHLDNRGPFGSSYFVNSDNNGPWADALMKELIPYIEANFRCIGEASARFLEGRSTGGWAALALQIFHPDFFNGAWAGQPDPVDFRAFQNINIYNDTNAFEDENEEARPTTRNRVGIPVSYVKEEIGRENVLGLNGTYTTSGGSWGAWNAAFAPRGADGFPQPLWDPQTGEINPDVAEHYKAYDLRYYLARHWSQLAPALQGKIRVWVGDMDTYYLNRAVHMLDDFLTNAKPPFNGNIRFGTMQDHTWSPMSAYELLDQMNSAYRK